MEGEAKRGATRSSGRSRTSRETGSDAPLDDRDREIAFLTLLLKEQEELGKPQREQNEWLCEVALAFLAMPRWWSLMPRSWRRKRMRDYFRNVGLFDGEDYLRRNPDVAATGADPLRHYLGHGIREGRGRVA